MFDFLTLTPQAVERDIENQLVAQITRFLLELGKGFAFLGRQYPLAVNGRDYFLDLLFYHARLKCYVVIELKAGEFKPERYITTSLKREFASENGTELNAVLPKMSPLNPQFKTKKQTVFQKIAAFVEKFKGVGGRLH